VSSEPEVRAEYAITCAQEDRGVFLSACAMRPDPAAEAVAEKLGLRLLLEFRRRAFAGCKHHAVLIANASHLHASQALAAMSAGKAVFCEKPLCLNESELAALVRASDECSAPVLRGRIQSSLRPNGSSAKGSLVRHPRTAGHPLRVNAATFRPIIG